VDRDHLAVLESGSTAHVSATDRTGTACAVTFSSGYGSGMIAAGTGIWLNNCLGEQELNPPGRRVAAGSRLLSNMAPTVGRHDDGATLAIGSPGADRITTAIVSALAGFVNGGLDLAAAIAHPRVHVHRAGLPDEEVRVEHEPSMYYGGVGAALTRADGSLEAVAALGVDVETGALIVSGGGPGRADRRIVSGEIRHVRLLGSDSPVRPGV
jgi:gamma-glutamyltranspeptidase/glutathione hydrolase